MAVIEDSSTPGADARPKRHHWRRRVATALLAIVVLAILVLSALKFHETFFLPAAPEARNAKEIARIQKAYEQYEKEFINPDKSTHGYTVILWGDNHSSRHTFSTLIKDANHDNAQYMKVWNDLKDRLARLKTDTTRPKEERDRMVSELENRIDEVHKMQTLFAINVGDLAYDGDATKYRLSLQIMNQLEAPMVTAVGNHDISSNGRPVYKKIWGPFYYSFAVGDSYFIVLDDADGKRVDAEQMKWLKAELEKSLPYNHCFVMMHVPLFKGQRNQNAQMKMFIADRKNAQEIKDMAAAYHVTFVVSGHIHTYDGAEWEVAGGPLTARMTPEGRDKKRTAFIITGGAGARLWKVDQDKSSFMSRARYHYFRVFLNGRLTSIDEKTGKEITQFSDGFRREDFSIKHADTYYTYEEIWVCVYAKLVNLYPWEMLVLVPMFLALLGYVLLDTSRYPGR